MQGKQYTPPWLSAALRPAFGLFLFLSQLTANRSAFFTQNVALIFAGIFLIAGSIGVWMSASSVLSKAVKKQKIAIEGPYKYVRHPIYVSIYLFFCVVWFLYFCAAKECALELSHCF